MSLITEHARSMIAYNHWANGKILAALDGLGGDGYAEAGPILAHAVGTQLYWHANWTNRDFEEPDPSTPLERLRILYEQSDAELAGYADALTDEEWVREEAWWKRWGFDAKAPVGPMIFQVIYHGIQHRAEAAMILTEHGCSPGDLDYLVYLREEAGGLP